MEIINCEQRSDEWFELRKKRVTASNAQAIGNYSKGLKSYILDLMSQYYSHEKRDSYTNANIERGCELEQDAETIYSFLTEEKCKKVGFVIYSDFVGCSPDLFVGKNGLAEIKCPNDKNYFELLIEEKIDTKYIWQMQMQMLCCDKKWCDFVAYNPNFKNNIFIKRIYPDEKKQKSLLTGFDKAEDIIKKIELRMQ